MLEKLSNDIINSDRKLFSKKVYSLRSENIKEAKNPYLMSNKGKN
jgi:hypothetical protein